MKLTCQLVHFRDRDLLIKLDFIRILIDTAHLLLEFVLVSLLVDFVAHLLHLSLDFIRKLLLVQLADTTIALRGVILSRDTLLHIDLHILNGLRLKPSIEGSVLRNCLSLLLVVPFARAFLVLIARAILVARLSAKLVKSVGVRTGINPGAMVDFLAFITKTARNRTIVLNRAVDFVLLKFFTTRVVRVLLLTRVLEEIGNSLAKLGLRRRRILLV